jgi:hypothetical protein
LLTVLGSCGNPANSAIQDIKTDQKDPVGQDPSGKTPDVDQSDPDDPEEDNETDTDDEAGTDGEGGESNTDDENDPGDVEDPDHGEGSDTGEQPDNGDGSGSGDGQGSGGNPGSEEQPDGGVALIGSAAVQTYLDGQKDNTVTTPYLIKVGDIDLERNAAGNALKGLYSALSRFVILDLSGSYGEKIINASLKSNPNKANITGIILPPGLTTVDINAFADCKNLVSADLRDVTTVNHGAFSGCKNLETLIMEEVTKLENIEGKTDGAFYNCDSLTSVSLPKAMEIERETFNSCDSLSTVYAPRATVIGDSAFAGCKNLKHIVLGETPPALGDSVFANGKPEAIYVPASAVNTYKNTDVKGWTETLKAKVQAMP